MAGIGFSLKRLFQKRGILNLCKAYGYAGIVTIGPMLLGVLLLFGISVIARIGGLGKNDCELLNCMLTYSLLVSLLITAAFNMVVTRFVSDMLFEDKNEKVMPSFYGTVSIELVICLVIYGTFLIFSGATFTQGILCLWFSMVLIVVWTEMIYMTALKDFRAIVVSFALSLMIGFLIMLITVLIGRISIESFLTCVILGYGILAVRYLRLMLEYFPESEGSNYSFLKWFDKYPMLSVSGFMVTFGLFSHLVTMYFGPLREQVKGLFYGATQYEIPALLAFFSILITTISFVVSVEVNFYPKYSNYYGLFNNSGAIKDIELAGKEMIDMLNRELVYLGCKQVFTTVLFIVLGPPVIDFLMPGMSSLALSVYKILCVGYGAYAIANSVMLIELYFEDYLGAMIGTLIFAILSTGITVWQIIWGDDPYWGIGFLIGAMGFYFFSLIHLDWYTGRLPYFLLSRQSLLPTGSKGFLTRLSMKLDEQYEEEKNRKLSKQMKKA